MISEENVKDLVGTGNIFVLRLVGGIIETAQQIVEKGIKRIGLAEEVANAAALLNEYKDNTNTTIAIVIDLLNICLNKKLLDELKILKESKENQSKESLLVKLAYYNLDHMKRSLQPPEDSDHLMETSLIPKPLRNAEVWQYFNQCVTDMLKRAIGEIQSNASQSATYDKQSTLLTTSLNNLKKSWNPDVFQQHFNLLLEQALPDQQPSFTKNLTQPSIPSIPTQGSNMSF